MPPNNGIQLTALRAAADAADVSNDRRGNGDPELGCFEDHKITRRWPTRADLFLVKPRDANLNIGDLSLMWIASGLSILTVADTPSVLKWAALCNKGKYLGCKQKRRIAVKDHIGFELDD